MIQTSKGLLGQINQIYEYPPITKENTRQALLDVGDIFINNKRFAELWKRIKTNLTKRL